MFKRILTAALLATPLWALAADSAKATSAAADSAKAASAGADDKAKTTQRGKKMKACNKEAGDKALKGDERKKFMSQCLKGPAKS